MQRHFLRLLAEFYPFSAGEGCVWNLSVVRLRVGVRLRARLHPGWNRVAIAFAGRVSICDRLRVTKVFHEFSETFVALIGRNLSFFGR